MFRRGTEKSFVNATTVTRTGWVTGDGFGAGFSVCKDGTYICGVDNSTPQTLYIIDGRVGGTIATIASNPFNFAWHPNGSKVMSLEPFWFDGGGFRGRVLIFNPSGNLILTINNPRSGYNDFFGFHGSWSGNGNIVAVGSSNYSNNPTNSNIYARVHIYNANTGALITTILDPDGAPAPGSETIFGHRAWLNYDGSLVVISAYWANGRQGKIYIYNATNGSLIRTINSPDGLQRDWGGSCFVSDDCSRILAGQTNVSVTTAKVFLVDGNTGFTLATYSNPVNAPWVDYWGWIIAISADGSTIAIGRTTADSSLQPTSWDIYIYRNNSTTHEKIIHAPKKVYYYQMFLFLSQDGRELYVSQHDDLDNTGNGGVRIFAI